MDVLCVCLYDIFYGTAAIPKQLDFNNVTKMNRSRSVCEPLRVCMCVWQLRLITFAASVSAVFRSLCVYFYIFIHLILNKCFIRFAILCVVFFCLSYQFTSSLSFISKPWFELISLRLINFSPKQNRVHIILTLWLIQHLYEKVSTYILASCFDWTNQ